jgi:hypothetical protein
MAQINSFYTTGLLYNYKHKETTILFNAVKVQLLISVGTFMFSIYLFIEKIKSIKVEMLINFNIYLPTDLMSPLLVKGK